MDGDIFYADGTPLVIEGMNETITLDSDGFLFDNSTKRTDFIIASSGEAFCTIYLDGTYSINPHLTAEQYRQALKMVIEYFTKGKQ
mgnify:CR=1 FL=1